MERVVQFTGPRQVEVAEHASAALPPGHLRVRTRYSGISAGTELTAYRGTNPYLTRTWDPEARLFRDGAAGIEYPVAGWGYSEVGEVTEVSPELVGTPGMPVAGDLVWGIWGHRSEGIVPAERMVGHTLPDGLDPLAGAFARVGAIAYNAVLAGDIHLGEDVAVFGQGVIGLLTTRLAQLNGARVTAVDALDGRLATAKRVRRAATPSTPVPTPSPSASAKPPAAAAPTLAIEISGVYPALHEALRSVAVGGRVVASGFYQGDGVGTAARRRVPPQPRPADLLPDRRRTTAAVRPLERRAPPADLPRPGRRGPGRRHGPWSATSCPVEEAADAYAPARRATRRSAPGRPGILKGHPPMLKTACQEQLLPGDTLQEKWDFAQAAATTRSNCAARGTSTSRGRLARTAQPPSRTASSCPPSASTCCTSSARSTTDLRRDAIDQMKSQLSVIGESAALGAQTPASYGMFSRRLPPFEPPRGEERGPRGPARRPHRTGRARPRARA